jgi:prephenate dehydrogenase
MQNDGHHPIDQKVERPRRGAGRTRPLRVGIAGLGAVGASIGLDLVGGGFDCTGYDIDLEHMRKAVDMGAVSRSVPTLTGLAGCDAIFLSVPPGQVLEVAAALRAISDATLIDVASAKSFLTSGIRDSNFVPTHPMRGTNLSGPAAAREGLFRGAAWAITPAAGTASGSLKIAEQLIRSTAATPLFMDPWTHDRICARVSHLPHVLSSALALAALSQEPTEARLLAGTSFHEQTRFAAGNPTLWFEIVTTNKEAVVHALTDYISRLEGFLRDLKDGDHAAVKTFFCSAADLVENAGGGRP